MGDNAELQITPEALGKPSIRNPFESPNDYHLLREPLVPSPSVFKSKPVKATPPKFNWSIDEMASLLPVHIDPEEIQRQSFYLSQTMTDSDIEEKRQNAIEQFFTKGTIVPSPWAPLETRKSKHHDQKSSLSPMIAEEPDKISVGCQTTLTLPLEFDLEKVLGEYYRYEEPCDAVQESLSSSSLRRKLFLDGQVSYRGSDYSSPPSPERCHVEEERPSFHQSDEPMREAEGSQGEVLSSIYSSPLPCGMSVQTPSTGQLSSSPIQKGCFRACSLGSISSPLFPDRFLPAGLTSPTISPIVAQTEHTPNASAERKQSNLTPLGTPVDLGGTSCNESPFVDGCSPIRSCSPLQYRDHSDARPKARPRPRCWVSPTIISADLNPRLQDNREAEDHVPSLSSSSLHSMELDLLSPLTRGTGPARAQRHYFVPMQPLEMDEDKKEGIERKPGDEEEEEEEEEGGRTLMQLTSSCMRSSSATENSQIFVSLVTEGSSIRCDSSMQVDSGYNSTSAGTASLIDGFGSDCNGKESFSSNLMKEAFQVSRQSKVKVFYPHH